MVAPPVFATSSFIRRHSEMAPSNPNEERVKTKQILRRKNWKRVARRGRDTSGIHSQTLSHRAR